MVATTFDRDAWADFYARRHLKIEPSIEKILYLRNHEPAREICLIEVNTSIPNGTYQPEAIEFGVDSGSENEHSLLVLDVSPNEWESLQNGDLSLPAGWSLEQAAVIQRRR